MLDVPQNVLVLSYIAIHVSSCDRVTSNNGGSLVLRTYFILLTTKLENMQWWKNSITRKVDDELLFQTEYACHIHRPSISYFSICIEILHT